MADGVPLPGGSNDGAAVMAPDQVAQILDALGNSLATRRKQAIEWRQQSGIEQEWAEDEEAYEGIDDANRATETRHHRLHKPVTTTGTSATPETDKSRSTVFLNVTRAYTDAAAARIGDMLIPMDERNFAIMPTPIPELIEAAEAGEKPVDMPLGMGGQEDAEQQQAQQTVGTPAVPGPQDPKELAKAAIDKAKRSADKAQDRIDDWLTECDWHGENRKLVDDWAKLGTGILKGPFPVQKSVIAMENGAIVKRDETKPASVRVDPWNFYPSKACGENIHNGDCTWERDDVTEKTIRDMKGGEGVLDFQIDACIAEGPMRAIAVTGERLSERTHDDTNYEIWYFHGFIGQQEVLASGCECSEFKDFDVIPVMLTMVNNRVIRAALNPLVNGKYPYDLVVWQKRVGMPWGAGVARQIRTPQRMLNAATRNLMENGGLSAGPQIVILRGVVEPADGVWGLTPRKLWYAKADASLQDLKAAFMAINIDCRQADLMAIIQFALKMAEDVTGLPMLLQGQQGQAPDTVGGMTLLNNNGSTVLRRLARLYDDRIIKPHITRYYDWLLIYGEDEEEKGQFIIEARGSSVLVERDLNNQAIIQMAAMATNPAYGVDPRKYFKQLCLAQKLDPALFQYDDATWQKIQENANKGPADPRIQVQQLRNQMEEQLARMDASLTQQESARDRQLELILKEMELTASGNESADQIKSRLADTVIKVRAQTRLTLLKPPTEPGGKAPAGQAYQR